MVNINKYIKALLHPAGGHQGSHKAHQAGIIMHTHRNTHNLQPPATLYSALGVGLVYNIAYISVWN